MTATPGELRDRGHPGQSNQLSLLNSSEADYAYAYSFNITNLSGDIVDIEAWFRQRALVEKKIEDPKLGMALRHMPSGYETVNVMWMWARAARTEYLVMTPSTHRT
jgi:hypothetical protein